ncbi:MAG: quinone-dependent dihydroorotate dehydrogenase [Cyanobacteria bacterium]|nr:quinone-dependent dihydroorotate dehydrogenase [Cyanobacteriota bacterium]
MADSTNNDHGAFKGIYKSLLRPTLFRLDPEVAHEFAQKLFPAVSLLKDCADNSYLDARIAVKLAGQTLPTPIGLAAGFDKNAHLVNFIKYLGFSFAEIGSITALPSVGNPKPRMFRLPEDSAIINFLGLNGEGATAVAERLSSNKFNMPVAVNIAKTNHPEIVGDKAVADILKSFEEIKKLPLHYVAINVSCPNTHEDVLKEMDQLSTILSEVSKKNSRTLPIFLKLSPDSSDSLLETIIAIARDNEIAGFCCGNTSTTREGLQTDKATVERIGRGGLSGRPIKPRGLELCRRVYRLKEKRQQIIGCGGVFSGQDAFDYICAGATAVQLYTALVYEGPFAPAVIARELATIVNNQGINLMDVVGSRVLCSSADSRL